MRKFRTATSVIIMIIAGIVGLFAGAAFSEALSGAALFAMIAGIACIVYTVDNRRE